MSPSLTRISLRIERGGTGCVPAKIISRSSKVMGSGLGR
jgi:hypothetical protein